ARRLGRGCARHFGDLRERQAEVQARQIDARIVAGRRRQRGQALKGGGGVGDRERLLRLGEQQAGRHRFGVVLIERTVALDGALEIAGGCVRGGLHQEARVAVDGGGERGRGLGLAFAGGAVAEVLV